MQYQVDLTDQSPENGQKPLFGSLNHSKMHFCDIWMILHDLVMLSNAGKHLVLSHYAISSWPNRPKSRKWPKTSFLALWIIQKCIFLIFEWSRISDTMAKSFRPFSLIKICNIKLTRWTKLEKMANSTPGGAPAAYASHEKNSQKSTRIFPDMWFSRGGPRKALLSY